MNRARFQDPSLFGVTRWVAVCLALCLLASPYVYSWVPSKTYEGEPVRWWQSWPTMTLYTNSLGPKYTSAAKRALEAWSNLKGGWKFPTSREQDTVDTYVCYSDLDSWKSVAFGETYCGMEFAPTTLAITASIWDPDFVSLFDRDGFYKDADVIFNSKDWSWDVYSGPWRSDNVADFTRVAIHEFGHVIGLDHPDEHGQSRDAIMNSTTGDTEDLQLDDVLGIGGLRYGGYYRPDLVVSKPTASGNLVVDQVFSISAILRNRGNHALAAGSTELRYEYLDFSVHFPVWLQSGTTDSLALPAGGSEEHTMQIRTPDEAGEYRYRACADEVANEANTNNNCSELATFTVQAGPDLIVPERWASDDTLAPNESFTLSARVRNQGGSAARRSTLRYWISDDIIGGWSRLDDTLSVPPLRQGGSWLSSRTLTAPSDAGTYLYAACVDSVPRESDTSNNCSTGVPVTVAVGSPDLVVSTVSVDDDTLDPGQTTFLHYTVHNQGSGAAAGSPQVTAFRSADATIWWDDTSIATSTHVSIDSLGAGQTVSGSTWMPAAPSSGTWYYGACVQSAEGESSTTNNCSTGVPVTVAVGSPDLVVSTVSVDDDTLDPGQTTFLNYTVRNEGDDAAAGSPRVTAFRSADATIWWDDTSIATSTHVSIDSLGAGQTVSGSTWMPAAPSSGTWYYGACVESAEGESNTGNNCSIGVRVTVGGGGTSDRAVLETLYQATGGPNWTNNTNWLSSASLDQWAGVEVDASGRVTTLDLDTDPTGDSIGSGYGNNLVGPIPSELGQLTRLTYLLLGGNELSGPIPAALGDLGNLEWLQLYGNQLSGPIPAALGNLTRLTNLILDSDTGLCLATDFPLTTPFARQAQSLGVSVCQTGGTSDRAVLEALYHATGGPSWTNNTNWTTEVPLDQWTGVTIDANGRVTELILEENNLTGSIPVALGNLTALQWLALGPNRLSGPIPASLGNLPNLNVLSLYDNRLTGEIPASLGNLTNLSWLGIDGNQLSGEIPIELGNLTNLTHLILGRNQLTGQLPAALGNLTKVESLYLNQNQLTGPIPAELGNMAGLEFLGIDSHSGLCLEMNFPLATPFAQLAQDAGILVCGATGFDLVVESPVVSDDTLTPGQSFTLSATVRNQGTAASAPTLVRYYQSDDSIILNTDAQVGASQVAGLAAGGVSSHSIVLNAPPVAGTYYYGACVDEVAGESDVLNNCYPVGVAVSVTGGASERAVLEALYHATGGPNWTNNTNWLSSAPLSEWAGVQTDANGRVTSLDLDTYNGDPIGSGNGNNLVGPIPPELGQLTGLTELFLSSNELSGPIPETLGNLANLTWLGLAHNRLSGPIPAALRNLANLERLQLYSNQLSGPIPPALGALTSLVTLSLAGNQLSGPIPSELGRLASLEDLSLYDNALNGPIPTELGDLANLRSLSLWGNRLNGPIPPVLGSLANLEELTLSHNELSGVIPTALARLTNLIWLNIRGNRLTGPIPPELAQLPNLTGLVVGGNELSGPLEWLGDMTNLQTLGLWNLGLSGPIPTWLRNLTDLVYLRLYQNALSGPIPAWLGELHNLEFLSLSSNELAGPIPSELGTLTNLKYLYLSDNPLTGLVPQGLTQRSLRWFWIQETRVCVPADATFQTWLATLESFQGKTCGEDLTDEQYDRYRETWQGLAATGSALPAEAVEALQAPTPAFTDHPIRPGTTPLRAAHFRELRPRIAALRAREGLPAVQWTDPTLTAGVTPVKRVHLTELRTALDAVYDAVGRARPSYTDPTVTAGVTAIGTAHIMELRAAVAALE